MGVALTYGGWMLGGRGELGGSPPRFGHGGGNLPLWWGDVEKRGILGANSCLSPPLPFPINRGGKVLSKLTQVSPKINAIISLSLSMK